MYEPVSELANEVRLTFHALANAAERLHRDRIESSGRAVLEYLTRTGPAPVPDIARARGVTRQCVQGIVNSLSDRGLVTTGPNPSHRRSHLIMLTAAGTELIAQVMADEARAIGPLEPVLDRSDLLRAGRVLADLRAHLDQIEGAP